MSASKIKGLLKGLRYISRKFEEEEEEDMKIGHPTDVKHIAHIGCDGPSSSPLIDVPSWMTSFSSDGGGASSINAQPQDIKSLSQDTDTYDRSMPLPRRRQSFTSSSPPSDSSTSGKQRKSRRHYSTSATNSPDATYKHRNISEIPKKSRPKKTKEHKESRASRHGCGGSAAEDVGTPPTASSRPSRSKV